MEIICFRYITFNNKWNQSSRNSLLHINRPQKKSKRMHKFISNFKKSKSSYFSHCLRSKYFPKNCNFCLPEWKLFSNMSWRKRVMWKSILKWFILLSSIAVMTFENVLCIIKEFNRQWRTQRDFLAGKILTP